MYQSQKDLPVQFLAASEPVDAEIVIGSFGASQSYRNLAFQLAINGEASTQAASDSVERYGKLPEIHHIFKAGPKSPPAIVTLIFLLATLITIPILAATVCLYNPLQIGLFCTDENIVAVLRCQSRPPLRRTQICTDSSRCVRDIGHWTGGVLFPVLHILDPFPAAPCIARTWRSCIPERKPRLERSARTTTRWTAISGAWHDMA